MRLLPALLAASSGGHQAPPLLDFDLTLIVQIGIFLLLFVVLRQLVFAPFLQLRRLRHDRIAGAREQAEQLGQAHGARTDEYERRLRAARKEAGAQRAGHRSEAADDAQTRRAAARRQADEKLKEARARIAGSVPAAELALRTRADQLARMIASKVLGRAL